MAILCLTNDPKSVFLARLLPVVYFKSPLTSWSEAVSLHSPKLLLQSPKLLLQSSHLRKLHHWSPGCPAKGPRTQPQFPSPFAPHTQFIRKGCRQYSPSQRPPWSIVSHLDLWEVPSDFHFHSCPWSPFAAQQPRSSFKNTSTTP